MEIQRLRKLAAACRELGEYAQAEAYLQEALPLAETAGEEAAPALVLSDLGELGLNRGQTDAAARYAQQALARVDGAPPAVRAHVWNNLGNVRAAQADWPAARQAFAESLALAEQAGAAELAAGAALNYAEAQLREAGPAAPEALAAAAQRVVRLAQDSYAGAFRRLRLGRLYQELAAQEGMAEWRGKAHAVLSETLRQAEALDNPVLIAYAAGYLGEVYAQAGQADPALALFQRARFAAHQADAPDVLYLWQWAAGRLYQSQGQTAAALRAYREAVASLQSLRMSATYTGQLGFREDLAPLYLALADLLLRQAETDNDQAKLREARDTVELLKAAELQDYYRDDCVTAVSARSTVLESVDPHTAVLYPISLPRRLVLLLSLADGIRQVSVPVDEAQLAAAATEFRYFLETRSHYRFLGPAQTLYRWLVEPLRAALDSGGIDTLVIVPGGPLRTVPLAALHDGQRFLVERYALATTPGLKLTDPRALPRRDLEILLAGLSEGVQGFAALPGVPRELAAIRKLYGGTLLQDREFSTAEVRDALAATPYTIVHIASHGQFDSDPAKTFVLTYDGRLSMSALEQFLAYSRFRPRPVELLSLSACQTAAGDERAALGLAGVAVKAGARSALASLWSVNDEATARLMDEFYRRLHEQPELSKAKALQQAQIALLRERLFRHPAYWAAFLLIGNWL